MFFIIARSRSDIELSAASAPSTALPGHMLRAGLSCRWRLYGPQDWTGVECAAFVSGRCLLLAQVHTSPASNPGCIPTSLQNNNTEVTSGLSGCLLWSSFARAALHKIGYCRNTEQHYDHSVGINEFPELGIQNVSLPVPAGTYQDNMCKTQAENAEGKVYVPPAGWVDRVEEC
ncbi:unnamed protein product [Ixodes persulcatus]